MLPLVCFLLALGVQTQGQAIEEPLLFESFPTDFKWGAATSAYQVREPNA